MRRIVLTATALLIASGGAASAADRRALRPPIINLSAPAAVKYAFREGCMPAVVEGRPVGELLRPMPVGPKSPDAIMISTAVAVEEGKIGYTVQAAGKEPRPCARPCLTSWKAFPCAPSPSADLGPCSRRPGASNWPERQSSSSCPPARHRPRG